MLRSNRGAARVSAVWMISVGVVALVALAFGFISQSDLAKQEEAKTAAEATKVEAEARADAANEKKRNISEVLGWYDRQSADPESNLDAARDKLEDLRAAFADVTETDTDFEAVVPKIVDAYNARGDEIARLKTRIQTLEGEVRSANNAVAQIRSQKDQTIAQLQQQLSDEQQNAQQRQQELEDRLDGISQQLADRDAELRSVRAEVADLQRGWADQKRLLDARVLNLTEDTKFRRGEFATQADGKILEVSQKTGIAWIDRGANNRVARGMRFRVEGGLPGQRTLKAFAEVTSVDANRAQVVLSAPVDRYDPVQPGDVIVNPIYDPDGGRNAVLAGNFSDFSRKELEALLKKMNITLQDEVGPSTHFLITGGTVYNDQDTNEPLEEPIPVTELAVYQNAIALQVQIVPLADLREFFRFGA